MNLLKRAGFKDLNQMTIDVAEKFFFAKKIQELKIDSFLAESGLDEQCPYSSYLLKVQEAYETLNDLEKNLINNEFFYQSYNNWWKPLYSKATFYRYKKEAMRKFLRAMYD